MKKITLFFALLLICKIGVSQLTYQWANSAGSTVSEYGQAIASDPSGNVYVAGSFSGTVDFDPSAATATLAGISGSQDIFLAKYTSAGNFIWVKQIAGTNTERPFDVVADASGAYLAGIFMGTIDFDPSAVTNATTSLGGGPDGDAFFAKYDVNGNLVWVDRIGSTGNDRVVGIALDASSNVFITGFIGANADMDPSAASASLNVSGTYNAYFAKYTSAGAYVFAKQITGGYSEGDDIALDASGNIYITGSYATGNDFDPSAGTANLSTSSLTQLDIFLAKYTSAGLYTYAKQIGGVGPDIGFQVAPDASGNVYLGGVFSSSCDFDPTAATSTLTSAGQGDLFVAKYDVSGNLLWKNGTGGTNNDYCYGLGLDASNNVYITGNFQGTAIDFDPSASTASLTASSSCMYIAGYSSAGNYLFVSSPGNIASDGKGLVVNSSLYVTGMFASTGDFDFGVATSNLTAVAGGDVFFGKYNTCIGSPPLQPSTIAGNFTVCNGSSQTYSVTNDPLATSYTWTFPSGWTNSSTTNVSVPTVSAGGIISVVANNACGASPASTVSISSMIISTSTITAACSQSNGVASATASGGVPAYSYTWSTGFIGQTLTNITAGTYTVNVKDANNCLVTTTVVIPNASGPTLGISSFTNPSCFGGNNGIATTTTSGGSAGPGFPTYIWTNGQTTANATNLLVGVYTVTLTDAAGCKASASVTIVQPASLTINVSSTNPKCFNASNGSATATVLGGTPAYTYSWSPTPGAGGTTSTPSGMVPGIYTVMVTDSKGCIILGSVALANPGQILSSVSFTNVSCSGGCNGMAIASLTNQIGTVSYSWIPTAFNTQSVNAFCAGTYTLMAKDQNSCTTTTAFNITQPSSAVAASFIAFNGVSCNGGTNGSATILASGGNPGYTYLWTPSAQTNSALINATAGNYTCTVTDANGCSTINTINLFQPPAIVLSAGSITNVACNGYSNGAAQILVSGGTPNYTYVWSPTAQTNSVITGVPSGIYTCSVTDASGCGSTKTVSITQPLPLLITTNTIINNACFGYTNGQIAMGISGGTPSYSITWSPTLPSTTTVSNLAAGNYFLNVTDVKGCVTNSVYTITQPTALSYITVASSACANINGSATVLMSGGVSPYSYSWTPTAQTTSVITGLSSGAYTVVSIDANNCSVIATVNVPFLVAPTITAVSNTSLICVGQTATLTANGANTYTWSTTATNSIIAISPLITTTYTVNGSSSNGCTNTATITQAVSPCTGINTALVENEIFKAYPNPFSNEVMFSINNFSEEVSVKIYNTVGQLVFQTSLKQAETAVNMQYLPAGIYFAQVYTNSVALTIIRLIKE